MRACRVMPRRLDSRSSSLMAQTGMSTFTRLVHSPPRRNIVRSSSCTSIFESFLFLVATVSESSPILGLAHNSDDPLLFYGGQAGDIQGREECLVGLVFRNWVLRHNLDGG